MADDVEGVKNRWEDRLKIVGHFQSEVLDQYAPGLRTDIKLAMHELQALRLANTEMSGKLEEIRKLVEMWNLTENKYGKIPSINPTERKV